MKPIRHSLTWARALVGPWAGFSTLALGATLWVGAPARAQYVSSQDALDSARANLDQAKQQAATAQDAYNLIEQQYKAGIASATDRTADKAALDQSLALLQKAQRAYERARLIEAIYHRVDVHLSNATIGQAADALAKAGDIPITVDRSIPRDVRLTVDAVHVPLRDVLESIATQNKLLIAPDKGGVMFTSRPTLNVNGKQTSYNESLGPWTSDWGVRSDFYPYPPMQVGDERTGPGTTAGRVPVSDYVPQDGRVHGISRGSVRVTAGQPADATDPITRSNLGGTSTAVQGSVGEVVPVTVNPAAPSTVPGQSTGAAAPAPAIEGATNTPIAGQARSITIAPAPPAGQSAYVNPGGPQVSAPQALPPAAQRPGTVYQSTPEPYAPTSPRFFGQEANPFGEFGGPMPGRPAPVAMTSLGSGRLVVAEPGAGPAGEPGVWLTVYSLIGDRLERGPSTFHAFHGPSQQSYSRGGRGRAPGGGFGGGAGSGRFGGGFGGGAPGAPGAPPQPAGNPFGGSGQQPGTGPVPPRPQFQFLPEQPAEGVPDVPGAPAATPPVPVLPEPEGVPQSPTPSLPNSTPGQPAEPSARPPIPVTPTAPSAPAPALPGSASSPATATPSQPGVPAEPAPVPAQPASSGSGPTPPSVPNVPGSGPTPPPVQQPASPPAPTTPGGK